jgi:hypothetical protein
MINVKRAIIGEVQRDKEYLELELARVAENQNMPIREKVETMKKLIMDLTVLNATFGSVDAYIPEPQESPQQSQEPQVTESPQSESSEEVVNKPVEEVSDEAPVSEGKKSSPFPKK